MDVVNGLARARVHIKNGAVALLMDVRLHGQCFSNLKYVAYECIILRR
jgi:hypothetical protein